jgi:hypothetical protein
MVLPPLEADPCIEEKFSVGKQEEGAVEDAPDDEVSSQANSMQTAELEKALKEWGDEENSRVPSAEELAAIPEASPDQSSTRRSKRRAAAANEKVGVLAERHKASRNEGIVLLSPPPIILLLTIHGLFQILVA